MTEAAVAQALHRMRSALNGVTLQLEVARLAVARADEARLGRALDGAAQASVNAAVALDALATLLADDGA